MKEYTVINKNGYVVGWSRFKTEGSIEAPIKPFTKPRWNGKEFVYDFPEQISTDLTKGYNRKAVSDLYFMLTSNVWWVNGKETRKHNGEISVLIPCYKQSEYVMTAVKSCLKQSQKPTDIIVLLMDEDSYKLEKELTSLGVTCYKEERMNVCEARTYLAKVCKTDWLIFLDADDFLLSGFIEKLDKYDSAVVKPNSVEMYSNEMKFSNLDDIEGEATRPERSVHNNLTCLMHKDVFFDIGLKEEYCNGGEDFDFLIRLWASKKWKVEFVKDVFYVYVKHCESESLSDCDDFYRSLFQVIVDNKDFLIEGVLNTPDKIDNSKLKAKWLVENPSEENLEKFAISISFDGNETDSELDYFCEKMEEDFKFWLGVSERKNTDSVYNEKDYVFINCDSFNFDKAELVNTTFDAVFFNLDCNDIERFVIGELSCVIRKDLWEKLNGEYSKVDFIFYLFKNYSCFVKNFTHTSKRRLVGRNDEFICALKEITFDKDIQKSAQIIYDYYTDGMFTCIQDLRYPVTFTMHKVCNECCPYCFQKGQHKQNISDEEMFANFDKALTYFEKLCEQDTNRQLSVQIMGGEPTLWSEWLQNKILERVEKYHYVNVFTNGYNKSAPLYKSTKTVKMLHIINWQQELGTSKRKTFRTDERPLFIVQEKERDEFRKLVETYEGDKVRVAVCKSTDPSENVSLDFMKEIAECKNPFIGMSYIKDFVDSVSQHGYDAIRKRCQSVPIVSEVDCENLMVRPCCQCTVAYPLEKFDLTKQADWEKDCCNCYYIY